MADISAGWRVKRTNTSWKYRINIRKGNMFCSSIPLTALRTSMQMSLSGRSFQFYAESQAKALRAQKRISFSRDINRLQPAIRSTDLLQCLFIPPDGEYSD